MRTASALEKARLLLAIARRRPAEAVDRVRAVVETRADRFWPRAGRQSGSSLREALLRLEPALGRPLAAHLADERLRAVDADVERARDALAGPFAPVGREADAHVGALVPPALRGRWAVHRGASRRVLPALLDRLGPIGVFVHDSLHTYLNVRDELRLVGPRLGRPAAVVIDDADMNGAPDEWATRHARASAWIAEERKRRTFAVALAG
jgi:hypothetical protein